MTKKKNKNPIMKKKKKKNLVEFSEVSEVSEVSQVSLVWAVLMTPLLPPPIDKIIKFKLFRYTMH